MLDQNRLKEIQALHDKIDKACRTTADSGKLPPFGEILYMLVNAREALHFAISTMIAQDSEISSLEAKK